jgi:uncharacterized repeat protein (TIGR01451 family)
VPAGYNETNSGNNVSPVTTSNPGVDLRIVKTAGAGSYSAGGAVSYTIDVTNNSPFTVNGVTVTDIFSGQIDPLTLIWNCAAPLGTSCTPNGTGNINDTINMAPGATVTYAVSGNARAEARGDLPNTARVTAPAGFVETNPGDEAFPTSISGPSEGNINIGGPGGGVTTLPDGGPPLVMVIPPIVANGDGAYDLVFYEMVAASANPPGQHIDLDWVQIEISADGSTWYTVFDWGDGAPNPHTNVPVAPAWCVPVAPDEADNCGILSSSLRNGTGVTINIDAIVPPGNYSWIRITSPASPGGDGSDVDAIEILP